MIGNLKNIAIAGAFFTGFGQLTKATIHISTIVLLAHLLSPSDFGLTAMVFPIIAFATVLQEAGLGAAVIQRENISGEELSTIFWLNAIVGLGLSLIVVAVSPFLAAFYGDPRVGPLTAASASLVLLGSLSAQPMSILGRNLHYRSLAIIDVTALVVGFSVAVGTALVHKTYWAIWLLSFSTTCTTFAMSWMLSGWIPRRCAPVRQVVDMLRFGGNITLFDFFSYFGRNLDNVLIGKFWGNATLGLYDRAYKLLLLPLFFVNSPLQRLVVPILSRTRDDPVRYRKVYISTLQMALIMTVPLVVVLTGTSERSITIVLGPAWIEAAPIFQWLGLASLVQLVTTTFGWLFISQGRARHMMIAGAGSSGSACLSFLIGLPWGAVGVAAAYAINEILKTPVLIWWVTREGPFRLRDATSCVLPFAIAAGFCFGTVHLLDVLLHVPALIFLSIVTIATYVTLILALLITKPGRACVSGTIQLLKSSVLMLTSRLRPAQAV